MKVMFPGFNFGVRNHMGQCYSSCMELNSKLHFSGDLA